MYEQMMEISNKNIELEKEIKELNEIVSGLSMSQENGQVLERDSAVADRSKIKETMNNQVLSK